MKRMRYIALYLAAVLIAALCGCGLFDGESSAASSEPESSEAEIDPEYPVTAGGVSLQARPGKVVSLAPSLTEKLCDLGLDDRLAGVSDYCDYPSDIMGLPVCGTAQLPGLAEIAHIGPDLVLTESALPDEAAAALEEQGIAVAVIGRAESVDGLIANYTDIAALMEGKLSGAAMGAAFEDEFRARLDEIVRAAGQAAEGEQKKALYLRLLDFTVATGDTFENELMELIGLENIAAGQTGWNYPEEAANSADGKAAFTSIEVIYMDPDFVTIKDLEQSAFYKGLPAVIKDKYLYIDSIRMERQSLRTLSLLEEMADYAYGNEA